MQASQLKTWREANQLSQAQAAAHLGKSLRTYIRYEHGDASIPEDVAASILATPLLAQADVELCPPFAKGETPWTHPRLFRHVPGKMRWERRLPGTPMGEDEWTEPMRLLQAEDAARAVEVDAKRPLALPWPDDENEEK